MADLAKTQDSQQISESAQPAVEESKFSKLTKELGKNPKIKNPAAVAATIGREKYGQKAMTAKSVAGRKGEELDEKWAGDTKLNPEKKGMFKGKTKADLEKQLAALHKTGPHKKGSPEYTKQQELNFAIRAKSGWKEGQEMADEGNAFTGALAKTPKGGKFKVGGKEFTDTSSIEEGFADMDAWLAQREKEKGTGKFDKSERTLPSGMKATTYTRRHEDEPEDDEEVTTITIKKKGRPKGTGRKLGAKGPTGKSKLMKKGAIKEMDMEGHDDHNEAGEFGEEGEYIKSELHTMVRVARDLEKHLRDNEDLPTWCIGKISQAKGMLVGVVDYILSEKERGVEAATGEEGITMEKAPPGAKAERMVKHIKKALSKDGHLSDKDKAIAYATTWKAHNQGKVEEESTAEKDDKAEKAAKKVTKDIEYDEGHKGKDDRKAEKAGKKVAKDIEYDDKKDKEEKVDETTVAGSVATATASGKSSKGGITFGKGVYESFNNNVEKMINESISVESKMSECGEGMSPGITIQANGEEAAKLLQLLKLAGLGENTCPACGHTPCDCESLEENKPDWPTNTETLDSETNLRTYSGGLNGPKSTGQSTTVGGGIPNYQVRRQVSMEENVELERTLFKTWKNYKG